MQPDRVGTLLWLEGHGEVIEILPFVFQSTSSDGRLFFDRFARQVRQDERPAAQTQWVEPALYAEAIALLDKQVSTFDLVPGLDPQFDPVGYAALIAAGVHLNQQDKLGFPYIEHPRRVFLNSEWALDPEQVSEQERMVAYQAAWLHDAIEDSDDYFYRALTPIDLANWGFDFEVIATVMKLTRNPLEPNADSYYEAIKLDEIARGVKLADIADNLASWRTALLSDAQQSKLAGKYQAALDKLGFSKDRDGDWFELRLGHFDQGPLATFAREESKTALARARQLRSQSGKQVRRPRPRILAELDEISASCFEIVESRFWETELELSQGSTLPKRYSLEALYGSYLRLYAAGQTGDDNAVSDSQLLAEVIDTIDRSEASFAFAHLGLVPRDITSHDIKLRFPRALVLLHNMVTAWDRVFQGSEFLAQHPMVLIAKEASMSELIDAAFIDFHFGRYHWGRKVFKHLLVEIEERTRERE
jgi:hypothetical protein